MPFGQNQPALIAISVKLPPNTTLEGYLPGFTKFRVYNTWFYSSGDSEDYLGYVRGVI
jgi:hypothetical protein